MATTKRSGRGDGGSNHNATPHVPIVPYPVVPAAATASYASDTFKPEPFDPSKAREAAARWAPTLEAIAADKLLVPRVDVNAAALALLNVHAFSTQVPALHARFVALSTAGEFTLANLDALRDLGFQLIDAQREAELAGAFKTNAKVPAETLREAREVEKRMQSLCEYMFAADRDLARRLATLRPGSDPRDTALDLIGYADIYDLRPREVASDTTNYRATDLAEARRLAGEILSYLATAMSPKARAAYVPPPARLDRDAAGLHRGPAERALPPARRPCPQRALPLALRRGSLRAAAQVEHCHHHHRHACRGWREDADGEVASLRPSRASRRALPRRGHRA
jgi:hypothetical protein